MQKELHTDTHQSSPEEILREKILAARMKSFPTASEQKSEEKNEENREEFYPESFTSKTWYQRNESIIIGAIVLIVVIAGCIIWNVLGV